VAKHDDASRPTRRSRQVPNRLAPTLLVEYARRAALFRRLELAHHEIHAPPPEQGELERACGLLAELRADGSEKFVGPWMLEALLARVASDGVLELAPAVDARERFERGAGAW
jgi:hypothetical protein